MSDFTIGKKAYTALFITDYKNAKPGWRQFVDTIINNLYNRPVSEGWVKFNDLPEIQFSVIDIAESKDQAMRMLGESRYDVVIVNNMLDGKPIGGGMLKRFKEVHQDSMFIPLLDISQRPGHKKKDGTISTGEGLNNIFLAAFYNGMFKVNFSVRELARLILSGGRDRDTAGRYYGFMPALADNNEQKNIDDSKKVQQTSSAQTLTKPLVQESQGDGAVSNMVDKSTQQNTAQSIQQPDPKTVIQQDQTAPAEVPISSDTSSDSLVNGSGLSANDLDLSGIGISDGVAATIKQRVLALSEQQPVDALYLDDLEGLNRKKKRNIKQRVEAWRNKGRGTTLDMLAAEAMQAAADDGAVKVAPVDIQKMETAPKEEEKSAEEGQGQEIKDERPYQRKPEPKLSELKEKEQERERQKQAETDARNERAVFNSQMVSGGMLMGKVMFARDKTILVEVNEPIEDMGLSVYDFIGMPVSVPYTKFNTNFLPGN